MRIFLIVWALVTSLLLQAQPVTRPLHVGDVVPDISLLKVLNYSSPSFRLSDCRGKVLILDFWSTWCSVCINQFPHLTALQEEFKGKLVIMPVGFDSYRPGSIEAFVRNRSGENRALRLPTVVQATGDSTLLRLFPTQSMPHEIWIDQKGVVLGITDQTAITEENVKKAVSGQPVDLGETRVRVRLEASSPFLIPQGCYGSLFCGYADSISQLRSPFGTQEDPTRIRLFDVNVPVKYLYRLAYRHEGWNKRVLTEGSPFPWTDAPRENSTPIQIDSFKRTNLFGYELVLPGTCSLNDAYNRMIDDLDHFFHIHSRISVEKVCCFALVRSASGTGFIGTGKNGANMFSEDGLDVVFRNTSLSSIVGHLNGLIPQRIVLDEVGYDGPVALELHLPSAFGVEDIRRNLLKYGLDLVQVYREMPMIVLQKE